MKFLRGAAHPFVSAALLLLAYPPFNLGLLVFAGLVPWLLSLREPTVRPFRSGYAFGFWFMLGQMHWLAALTERWTGSMPLAILPLVLAALLGAVPFAALGGLIAWAWRNERAWLIPLFWAGIEVFRSYVPVFAFPYGLIATPLWWATPLIQSGYFGGIYLTGAWVALTNVAIAWTMAGARWPDLRPLASAWVLVLFLSFVRFLSPLEGERKVVMAGQLGLDMAFGKPTDPEIGAAVERLIANAQTAGADLLVLPEGLTRVNTDPPTLPFDVPPSPPVLFGAQRGTGPNYQSAFAFDGTWHVVDKTRLVIFGEFVPGRSWIPFLSAFNLPSGDLAAGDQLKQLTVARLKIGPVICFESLFPDIAWRHARAGARLIAVPSIDDWYLGTGAVDQLRAASVWRAVETGLPVVRAASMGVTTVIDGRGRTVSALPLGVNRGLRAEVVVPNEPTAFPAAPLFPLIATLALCIPFLPRKTAKEEIPTLEAR